MINPSLHINKVFKENFEKWLRATSHENRMETILDVVKKKDTCIFSIIIFYKSNGTKPKKCIGC